MSSPEQRYQGNPSSSDSEQELLDADIFDYSEVNSPVVEHYKPAYLATGGNHIVYEVEGHPDIVVKVSFPQIRSLITYNEARGLPLNSINDEIREKAREGIKRDRQRIKTLGSYFGKEHITPTRKFLARIPITPKILSFVYKGEDHPAADEVWVLASAQRKLSAIRDPDHLSITSGYSESQENVDQKEYSRVNRELLQGMGAEGKYDLSSLLNVQKSTYLNQLAEHAFRHGQSPYCAREPPPWQS